MIQPYKHVAIIWGTSTQKYAKELAEKIEKRHQEDRYPLVADMVNSAILSNILIADVEKIFDQASYCVILISLDDIGARASDYAADSASLKPRIRQNVVLELGMAIGRFGDSAYSVLSDFDPKKVECDLPGDLNSITPTIFTRENFDAVADSLFEHLVKVLKIVPYKNLLSQRISILDYENLFPEVSASFYRLSDNNQILSLFHSWDEQIDSFDFYSEKIEFILERIKFFPSFSRDDSQVKRIFAMADKLEHGSYYLQKEDVDLEWAVAMTCAGLRYTAYRLDTKTQNCVDGFQEYREKLSDLEETLLEQKEPHYNPLILSLFYEFLGLSELHILSNGGQGSRQFVYDKLVRSASYLSSLMGSVKMIEGFITFDVARAASSLYEEKRDKATLDEMKSMYKKAIDYRKSWLRIQTYPGFFKNALSFEYFKARRYNVAAQVKYGTMSPDSAQADLKKILEEINDYNLQGLERLSLERSELLDYMKEQKIGGSFYD